MPQKYKDLSLSFEERINDLLRKMTIKEKMSQLVFNSPEIPRLDIPKYNWWNECLHGVARAGKATVFPQAIGLAAIFDEDFHFKIADAISTEARAKHHEFVRNGDRGKNKGLTFWTPNINIFRDPRWGRGQETYGEDPYLSGRLGVAFVKGLQGDDPKYLKLAATLKHFAVHSGPESERHKMNVLVNKKDMYESYLPHFKECVKEANVESVMCAYNRVNDEPACASSTLLQEILRKDWGFKGHVVSDCGAILDLVHPLHHRTVNRLSKAAAEGLKNGCDLNCGKLYRWLPIAFKKGLITEEDIDISLRRLLVARFKLGMFDPPELVKYQHIPIEKNDCEEHKNLATEAARKSIVLLKNEDNFLPLSKDIKKIAVIGPNADDYKVLLGNYHGTPSTFISPLQGIKNKLGKNHKITYDEGCKIKERWHFRFKNAKRLAKEADLVIMVLGLSQKLEREQTSSMLADDDRRSLNLPKVQQKLLRKIYNVNQSIALVLLNGSPITINWAHEHIPAIIEAWYPGQNGGKAIADILFGDYSPAGRLPVTFPKHENDLPDFRNYSMKNRTYRYAKWDVLYPFGYGLSYTQFKYSNLKTERDNIKVGEPITLSVDVENIGEVSGEEVVQVYLKDMEASVRVPRYELKGFKRISLQPSKKRTLTFSINPRQIALIKYDGSCVIEPGKFKIYVGGSQPDERSISLTDNPVLSAEFTVSGSPTEIEY